MKVEERFLKYVGYHTTSSEESESTPSTERQLVLAKELCRELISLGLSDARVDKYGYVYASLPATAPGFASVGLIAHMDTSDAASGENIKTRTVLFDGEDITLNEELGIVMSVTDYPGLKKHVGKHLIVTDGTTLLGADDKAGIAEIMTALERIIDTGIPHGKICVAFTPDEEIGRGADYFDVEGFGADYAYTLDGGGLGEVEFENFNAASAKVVVNGISIHPGAAKDKMKNAARIAMEFDSLLPQDEIPERTEGYEGFHHLTSMEGECERAELNYIIRDHDKEKFEAKKTEFSRVAEELNKKYGDVIELTLRDSYYNMKEIIDAHPYTIERACEAMKKLGIEPVMVPIRGGTDGSRLSFMGLPCPNLATGGENFHSRFEYAVVEAMEGCVELVVEIIKAAVALK